MSPGVPCQRPSGFCPVIGGALAKALATRGAYDTPPTQLEREPQNRPAALTGGGPSLPDAQARLPGLFCALARAAALPGRWLRKTPRLARSIVQCMQESHFARTCPVCGAPVRGKKVTAVYCSDRCRGAAWERRVAGRPIADEQPPECCPVCGRPVVQTPGLKRRHYCSRQCAHRASQRRRLGVSIARPDRACAECGAVIPGEVKATKRYCSQRCGEMASRRRRRDAAIPRPDRACAECGSVIPGGDHPNKRYCSPECQHRYWYQQTQRTDPEIVARLNAASAASSRGLKLRVLQAYGGRCVCCGESDPDVLTIDHIKGGGLQHFRRVGFGTAFYRMLEREEYPKEDYRLLCFNCNSGRQVNNGLCPHHGRDNDPVPLGCVRCGEPFSSDSRSLCSGCRRELRKQYGVLVSPTCLVCGTPIAPATQGGPKLICASCRYQRQRLHIRFAQRQRRERVIAHYGGRCAVCGETELLFLNLDHIRGDGAAHRRQVGGGSKTYQWIERNDYPDGFQVLCHNCNWKKGTTVTPVDGTA